MGTSGPPPVRLSVYGHPMSWLDALGRRAGPFAPAARRLGESPPRGSAGVRALTSRLDAFLDDEGADEHAFIAAAGGLLACLLVDSLGGTHVAAAAGHRVRLGAHALFDPFAVIDAAIDAGLDGGDPAAVLAEALSRAEADARDQGPEARAQRAFMGALAARPELRVTEALGWSVRLDDGSELDLDRLVPLVDDAAALARGAAALVALLPGGAPAELAWPDAAPRLQPRLVGKAFVTELGARADALVLDPLVPGLSVAQQLAYDGRARFVRRDERRRWQAEAGGDTVRERALLNLAARAPTWVREGPLVYTRTGDGLDGTRLILPGLGAHLDAELGPGPKLLAAPHRDVLVAGLEAQREALEAHARDAFARAPHGISPALYRRADGRLHLA